MHNTLRFEANATLEMIYPRHKWTRHHKISKNDRCKSWLYFVYLMKSFLPQDHHNFELERYDLVVSSRSPSAIVGEWWPIRPSACLVINSGTVFQLQTYPWCWTVDSSQSVSYKSVFLRIQNFSQSPTHLVAFIDRLTPNYLPVGPSVYVVGFVSIFTFPFRPWCCCDEVKRHSHDANDMVIQGYGRAL